MGNSLPELSNYAIVNHYRPQDWNRLPSNSNAQILVHKVTKQIGQVCRLHNVPTLDEMNRYQFRNKHQELLKIYNVSLQNQNPFCGSNNFVQILFQHIPYPFQKINNLTQSEALTAFLQILKAFRLLEQHFGPIDPHENLIGINSSGRIKVWLNKHPCNSYPDMPNTMEKSSRFSAAQIRIRKLYSIVQQKTNQMFLPLIIKKHFGQPSISFDRAIQIIQHFAANTHIDLSSYLTSQVMTKKLAPQQNNLAKNMAPQIKNRMFQSTFVECNDNRKTYLKKSYSTVILNQNNVSGSTIFTNTNNASFVSIQMPRIPIERPIRPPSVLYKSTIKINYSNSQAAHQLPQPQKRQEIIKNEIKTQQPLSHQPQLDQQINQIYIQQVPQIVQSQQKNQNKSQPQQITFQKENITQPKQTITKVIIQQTPRQQIFPSNTSTPIQKILLNSIQQIQQQQQQKIAVLESEHNTNEFKLFSEHSKIEPQLPIQKQAFAPENQEFDVKNEISNDCAEIQDSDDRDMVIEQEEIRKSPSFNKIYPVQDRYISFAGSQQNLSSEGQKDTKRSKQIVGQVQPSSHSSTSRASDTLFVGKQMKKKTSCFANLQQTQREQVQEPLINQIVTYQSNQTEQHTFTSFSNLGSTYLLKGNSVGQNNSKLTSFQEHQTKIIPGSEKLCPLQFTFKKQTKNKCLVLHYVPQYQDSVNKEQDFLNIGYLQKSLDQKYSPQMSKTNLNKHDQLDDLLDIQRLDEGLRKFQQSKINTEGNQPSYNKQYNRSYIQFHQIATTPKSPKISIRHNTESSNQNRFEKLYKNDKHSEVSDTSITIAINKERKNEEILKKTNSTYPTDFSNSNHQKKPYFNKTADDHNFQVSIYKNKNFNNTFYQYERKNYFEDNSYNFKKTTDIEQKYLKHVKSKGYKYRPSTSYQPNQSSNNSRSQEKYSILKQSEQKNVEKDQTFLRRANQSKTLPSPKVTYDQLRQLLWN